MIKRIIQNIAQRKNPKFKLDSNISNGILFHFAWDRFCALIRGLRALLFGNSLSMLMLGARVSIKGWKYFSFGKGVQIANDVMINAYGKEGLTIGSYCWIGSYSCLKVSFSFHEAGNYIRIGNNVGIGEYAHLGGAGGLQIGDDCIIGPYFSCHPENHQFLDQKELIRLQGVIRKGIKIGKNCWIGAKVTILDGVSIGDNCIIAAGAVINRDMPSNAVIGGLPARVIRTRSENDAINSTDSIRVA
jgi:acetyltransferase-like isoleucine patch superfamily enzyme